MTMEILVAYDIATTSPEGQRRLREVAKICEGYGLRVQQSVFECRIPKQDVRRLINDLNTAINPNTDRVAIYRLREPYERFVTTLGRGPELDWRRPVVL
jgi:CRISPR-associated protein Cas2